jgi:hypothetical protein
MTITATTMMTMGMMTTATNITKENQFQTKARLNQPRFFLFSGPHYPLSLLSRFSISVICVHQW